MAEDDEGKNLIKGWTYFHYTFQTAKFTLIICVSTLQTLQI